MDHDPVGRLVDQATVLGLGLGERPRARLHPRLQLRVDPAQLQLDGQAARVRAVQAHRDEPDQGREEREARHRRQGHAELATVEAGPLAGQAERADEQRSHHGAREHPAGHHAARGVLDEDAGGAAAGADRGHRELSATRRIPVRGAMSLAPGPRRRRRDAIEPRRHAEQRDEAGRHREPLAGGEDRVPVHAQERQREHQEADRGERRHAPGRIHARRESRPARSPRRRPPPRRRHRPGPGPAGRRALAQHPERGAGQREAGRGGALQRGEGLDAQGPAAQQYREAHEGAERRDPGAPALEDPGHERTRTRSHRGPSSIVAPAAGAGSALTGRPTGC